MCSVRRWHTPYDTTATEPTDPQPGTRVSLNNATGRVGQEITLNGIVVSDTILSHNEIFDRITWSVCDPTAVTFGVMRVWGWIEPYPPPEVPTTVRSFPFYKDITLHRAGTFTITATLDGVTAQATITAEDVQNSWLADLFARGSFLYHQPLAELMAELSVLAYGRDENAPGRSSPDPVRQRLTGLGFTQIVQRNYYPAQQPNHHRVAYTFAHREIVMNGQLRTLIAIVIRGTNGEEWHSNFDVGTGDVHEGFALATQALRLDFGEYVYNNNLLNPDENIIFITGHSRGAAVANLLAGQFNEDQFFVQPHYLFAYTFATPNTTRTPNTTFRNIYNFVNPEDFVPFMPLPMSGWDFGRHGRTYAFPVLNVVPARIFDTQFRNEVTRHYRELVGNNPLFRIGGIANIVATASYMHVIVPNINSFYNTIYTIPSPIPQRLTPGQFMGIVAGAAARSPVAQAQLVLNSTIRSPYQPLALFFVMEGLHNLRDRSPHDENMYLAWIRAINGYEDLVSNVESVVRRIRIACPVDVRIYDSNNQLVGRVYR